MTIYERKLDRVLKALSFREPDGAIDNSQFVTLTLTGPATMSVRWADASEQTGSFVVNGDAIADIELSVQMGFNAGALTASNFIL